MVQNKKVMSKTTIYYLFLIVMYMLLGQVERRLNMKVKNGIYLCDVMGCFCFVSRGKVTEIKIDKEE